MSAASISEYLKSPKNVAGFRELRGAVLASLGRTEPRSILVIPVSEHDDAAAVAAGSAASLAAPGYDVVLIDAQFARPSAHHAFAKDQGPGLAEALTDGADSERLSIQPVTPGLGPSSRRSEREPLDRPAGVTGFRAPAGRSQAGGEVGGGGWRQPGVGGGSRNCRSTDGRDDPGGRAWQEQERRRHSRPQLAQGRRSHCFGHRNDRRRLESYVRLAARHQARAT